jgi:hypothetical protein
MLALYVQLFAFNFRLFLLGTHHSALYSFDKEERAILVQAR